MFINRPTRSVRPLVALVALTFPAPASAQSAQNILLVINDASPVSQQVGDYYAHRRGVAPEAIVRIHINPTDEVRRSDYERFLESPVAMAVAKASAHDRVLYIVLTKGIPLRIAGTAGRAGTVASVDSELALLYRKLTGTAVPVAGPVPNPYFLRDASIETAKPFTHEAQDIFLVSRLDGFTLQDVFGLIDRGSAPGRDGVILLDAKASTGEGGDAWLRQAATLLSRRMASDRVALDEGPLVLADRKAVLGYYSWGSTDPAITHRHLGLEFVPGSIAGQFVSTDARTLTEPPPNWELGTWGRPNGYYAGSPQSLTGDLIRDGVTGVSGQVAEPYLDASVRPDILFPAYLAGFNLVESFYLAMPSLSWQSVVIGDPLCAPFRSATLRAVDIDNGLDPQTELPSYFSSRRLAHAENRGVDPTALQLTLRAEARVARGDRAGAREALEQATALDDRLVAAHLLLGSMYEQDADYDRAIDRYRHVLARIPNNPLALNNLAYSLAVRKGSPAEALPLAEKAYALMKGPATADTLGWILHLGGNDARAADLFAEAVKAAPTGAEIYFHAASVYAALGRVDAAKRELDRAVDISAELEKRDDVKALRDRLLAAPKP